MAYLVGTDEAGYGPNLGPLVISATAWRVPDELLGYDLYRTLAGCVTSVEPHAGDDSRVAIADSKQLYQPGKGLAALERGVLVSLRVLGKNVRRWREVFEALDACCGPVMETVPWHGGYDLDLPHALAASRLDSAAESLQGGLRRAGVELTALCSTVIFPEQFNDLLDLHDGKGAALSHCTLQLLRDLLDTLEPAPTLVVCDKHGGRNRYGPLLQHFFPEMFVESHRESRAASVYRWGSPARRTEVRFVTQGESFLPSALASMTSKYLRELAMAAFNDFWLRHKPGLRPTAGYPADAKRFKTEIADVQQALGIPERQLWRNR
jgi:ribonuclease HII